jgi:hypothetical protein
VRKEQETTHLERRLDQVEHQVPVTSTQFLHDRCEVSEELDETCLQSFRKQLVTRNPSRHRLKEEHRSLLREEDDRRVERRGGGEKLCEEREGFRVELRGGDAGERGGKLVLIAGETGGFEEDGLDRDEDGGGEGGGCGGKWKS